MTVYRIFISHASEDASFATQLANALKAEQLYGYVPPMDVTPGTQWLVTLERKLQECGALIAVLTNAFRASKWCDQEVGYALGLNHVVVPVRPTSSDPTPYGLLGWIQAITVNERSAPQVASEVFDSLLASKGAYRPMTEILIDRLGHERESDRLVRTVDRLERVSDLLESGQRARVAEFASRNAALRLDAALTARLSTIYREQRRSHG